MDRVSKTGGTPYKTLLQQQREVQGGGQRQEIGRKRGARTVRLGKNRSNNVLKETSARGKRHIRRTEHILRSVKGGRHRWVEKRIASCQSVRRVQGKRAFGFCKKAGILRERCNNDLSKKHLKQGEGGGHWKRETDTGPSVAMFKSRKEEKEGQEDLGGPG